MPKQQVDVARHGRTCREYGLLMASACLFAAFSPGLLLHGAAEDFDDETVAIEVDSVKLLFITQLESSTAAFQRLAERGSRASMINHLQALRSFAGSFGAGPEELAAVKEKLDRGTGNPIHQQLVDAYNRILSHQEQFLVANNRLKELLSSGYWPAIESQLRYMVMRNADDEALRPVVLQLLAAKDLDGYAFVYGAALLMEVSRNAPIPAEVLTAADEGIALGALHGHLVKAEYHRRQDDRAAVREALLAGRAAKVRDCIYHLGILEFQRDNIDQARDYFVEAFELGESNAGIFLGQIYATGSKNIPVDTRNAFAYFSAAGDANIPQGYEQIALLYAQGSLNAPIPAPLDLGPGVPPCLPPRQRCSRCKRISTRR